MTHTEAVAVAINTRFVLGTGANNDLASAGVVVHQTDAMDGGDGGVPWMTNDAYPDRFAASLVNANAPYMYSTSAVGIVISPAHLSMEDLWCIYPRDGNTMSLGNHGCGQGAYTTLPKMLAAQQRGLPRSNCLWGEPDRADRFDCMYNELVLKGEIYTQRLPQAIEAVFRPIGGVVHHAEGDEATARRIYGELMQRYYRGRERGGSAAAPPLLVYDIALARAGRPPFKPMDAGW